MLGIALDPTRVRRDPDSFGQPTPRAPERHDLYMDSTNNLAMVDGSLAVGQLAQQRLLTYRGEWFLDMRVGVPWLQEFFRHPFNEIVAEAIVKQSILDTPGVRELWSFDFNIHYDHRQVDIPRCEIVTIFDELVEL